MVYETLEEFPTNESCHFCHTRLRNEIELGEIANINFTYCHSFCLLLSNEILSRGKPIVVASKTPGGGKDVVRVRRLKCGYCRKAGATIKCSHRKCKRKFHLPCGVEKGSIHQFFGKFRSYCSSHRLKQKIPAHIVAEEQNCFVCQGSFQKPDFYIWPKCCGVSALIHKKCLQRLASYSGRGQLRCPFCNDIPVFTSEAKRLGVFIPQRPPAWERQAEDMGVMIICSATDCSCRRGRVYNRDGTRWQMEICVGCGSTGIHQACISDWKYSGLYVSWTCETCSLVVSDASGKNAIEITDSETDDELDESYFRYLVDRPPKRMLEQQTAGATSSSQPKAKKDSRNSVKRKLRNVTIIVSDSDDSYLEVISVSSTDDD